MTGYMPWDKSWRILITYISWIQPDLPGMENSPVLPAYPIFISSLRGGLESPDLYSAIAGAMVFLLGHEPEEPINSLYCAWLRMYNDELAIRLFYEGTEMTAQYNMPQAIWLLQASLLLEPYSYETNYNLSLAFNQLGTQLQRKERHREAGDCYRQAQQYLDNASQIKDQGEGAVFFQGPEPEQPRGYIG
ncbi:MAG: hypothetical protein LBK98_09580 [Peptococcaceae bacterium]|jgi:hypothetical protein|nr:hypothetical protein [Peptococcaceae bacterium]